MHTPRTAAQTTPDDIGTPATPRSRGRPRKDAGERTAEEPGAASAVGEWDRVREGRRPPAVEYCFDPRLSIAEGLEGYSREDCEKLIQIARDEIVAINAVRAQAMVRAINARRRSLQQMMGRLRRRAAILAAGAPAAESAGGAA